ncbi:translocation/assembly module TamB domain-containing protein [Chitinispirillales bacterium ANBcel5]|uniref:translocation/assembly module TamB domain-containing protein n=1 Tax=Cellulosispirillum alkaliphilum TaxID=3039283 RepID=UPI002A4ED1FE|nr:translocation/assembly module TamB domain-containing protein [Chitinispirillales bacterium ANBcel5]
MKRFILITAIVIATLVVALFATLAIAINSNTVHQYVIARVNESIPGSFKLDRLRITPFGIQVELLDFALLDPSGQELAAFERFFADVSLISLIRKNVVIRKATLEHPSTVIEIDSSGNLTLLNAFRRGEKDPEPQDTLPEQETGAPVPVELRNLDIIGGKVRFASQKDSIEIELSGLSVTASGQIPAMSADLSLAFDSLALKNSRINTRIFDLQLMAKLREMDLDSLDLRLNTEKSAVALSGRASSLANDPLINLTLTSDLSLEEVKSFAALEKELSGNAALRLNVSGLASNPDLDLNVAYDGGEIWGYPVNMMLVDATLRDRNIRLSPLRIGGDVGSIDLTGDIDARQLFPDGFLDQMSSPEHLKYNVRLSGNDVLLHHFAPTLSGAGQLSLRLEGRGIKPDSLAANTTIQAYVADFKPTADAVPQDAQISLSAALTQGIVHISEFSGNVGTTNLDLSGGYNISSGAMDADLSLSVPSLAEVLHLSGIDDSVSGSATLLAQLGGDITHPRAVINLTADTVAVGDIQVDSLLLSAGLERDGRARIERLTLNRLNSEAELSGSTQLLHNGSLIPVSEMEFDVALFSEKLQLDDFIEAVSGTVAIDATVQGTIDDPRGHVRLSAADISAAEQNISEIHLQTRLENQRAYIEPLQIALLPGQELSVSGWAALKDSFDLRLSAPQLDLNELSTVTGLETLYGKLSLALQARGTYQQPQADGMLNVTDISIESLPVKDISLQLSFKDQLARVAGTAMGDISATYNIDTKDFDAALRLDDLLLDPYLALTGQNLEGRITAALSAEGNTDSLAQTSGLLDITDLKVGYDNIPVIETNDLRVSVQNNQYTVPQFSITLVGEGSLSGNAQGLIEGPHEVTLNGDIPLALSRHFTEELPDIEGNVVLDISFTGMADAPDLSGDVRLNNIALTLPGIAQRLHSVNGRIVADNRSVRLQSLRGNLDEGSLDVRGELKLDDFSPSDLRADVVLRRLPVAVPDMLDLVVDARVSVTGNSDTTRVSGDVVLLDGVYYQDVVINPLAHMGQRRRRERHVPQEIQMPYLRNMRFDVGIQARAPFRVNNNLANLTIIPDLQLMGTLNAPALNGRANVREGTVTYLRNEFEVRRGVIDFVNPYAIEPRIDIRGVVPVDERIIQLEISGTLDDLIFQLGSNDPTLEDQDILSLLILGQTIGDLQDNFLPGASGTAGQTNQQILASLIASTFGDDIRRATGLDIFEVETGDELDEESDRIAVTMGKQFTRQLSTRYTVESREGEIVQRAAAEFRILQNLLIGAFQDTRGIYGGELRLIWEAR